MEDGQDRGLLRLFNKKNLKEKEISSDDSKSPNSRKVSIATDEDKYDTRHKKLGFALVFNQYKIKGLGTRMGSVQDSERITNALELYGFEVQLCPDFTKQQIYQTLSDYSNKDHSENDCFVVVVMSHGKQDEIYAADKLYKVEKLWESFLGENCKSLINKPKLFFIQCCRGKNFDHGSQFQTDSLSSSLDLSRSLQFPHENELIRYNIPHTADLLVYYSTYRNYVAWRPETGSIFIQTLAIVLEESAEDGQPRELYSLLTKVNRKVAFEYQTCSVEEKANAKKQMPCIESTLTKMFFIQPKIEITDE